nr:lactate utilization protein [Maliibacterium massiliense]
MSNWDELQKNLEKKRFCVRRFATAREAADALVATIGSASVGVGGSMTVEELDVEDRLRAGGSAVYWHWREKPEDRTQTVLNALTADYYLCSSNAVTKDGRFFNIDGSGNRVASMIMGTGTLIMLIGKNKLVSDGDDPIARIKREACPPNAKRLHLNIPCAITGKCMDCTAPDRFCNVTIIIEFPLSRRAMQVWMIDEPLGY